jgi:hypothetical protein
VVPVTEMLVVAAGLLRMSERPSLLLLKVALVTDELFTELVVTATPTEPLLLAVELANVRGSVLWSAMPAPLLKLKVELLIG